MPYISSELFGYSYIFWKTFELVDIRSVISRPCQFVPMTGHSI